MGTNYDAWLKTQEAQKKGEKLAGQTRQNDKISMKGLQDNKDNRAEQFQTTFDTNVTGRDMHTVKPGEGANLLGFQGSIEYKDDDRRGPRRDAPAGGKQQQKGGRKNKMVVDDSEFPAIGF